MDGRTIRTALSHVVAGGSTTLVGQDRTHRSTWRRVVAGRLVPFLSATGPVVPMVSADGSHVAWMTWHEVRRFDEYTTRIRFTVTAYDVRRGRRTGSATIARRVTCCDAGGVVDILGVNRDGAVVLHAMGGPSWYWRPGRTPVRVRLPDDQWLDASNQWPHGITFATQQDGGGPAAFARVDRHGRVHRVGRIPVASTGMWSPDGTAYAFAPFSKTQRTRARIWRDGRVTRLDAPRDAAVLMWESPTAVLLVDSGDVDTGPVPLVRCDAITGTCERAGRPLRHPHLPETLLF